MQGKLSGAFIHTGSQTGSRQLREGSIRRLRTGGSGDDVHQDGTRRFPPSPRASARVTVVQRRKTNFKSFLLNLCPVYSPDVHCSAAVMTQASGSVLEGESWSGHLDSQTGCQEWSAGRKKRLEMRTGDEKTIPRSGRQ